MLDGNTLNVMLLHPSNSTNIRKFQFSNRTDCNVLPMEVSLSIGQASGLIQNFKIILKVGVGG